MNKQEIKEIVSNAIDQAFERAKEPEPTTEQAREFFEAEQKAGRIPEDQFFPGVREMPENCGPYIRWSKINKFSYCEISDKGSFSSPFNGNRWPVGTKPAVNLDDVAEGWAVGEWFKPQVGDGITFFVDEKTKRVISLKEGWATIEEICYGWRYRAYKLPDKCPDGYKFTKEFRIPNQWECYTLHGPELMVANGTETQPASILRKKSEKIVEHPVYARNGYYKYGPNESSVDRIYPRLKFRGYKWADGTIDYNRFYDNNNEPATHVRIAEK